VSLAQILLPSASGWSVAFSGRATFRVPVPAPQSAHLQRMFACLREAVGSDIDDHGELTRVAYGLAAVRMGEPAAALRVVADLQTEPNLGPEDGNGGLMPDIAFIRDAAHVQLGDRAAAVQ
jgi:hypothetical protein